jgi:hypothetical protein
LVTNFIGEKINHLTRTHLKNLRSEDRELQNSAFTTILQVTDQPVDWKDNHVRSIAAQSH